MKGEVQTGCYLVFLAAFFDFFDGLAARALNAWSSIGKELDSLADVISFGLVPGLIIFRLLQPGDFPVPGQEWAFTSFLVTVFSALRLASFNVDDRQKNSFLGLPTPACGLFIASLPFIPDLFPQAGTFIGHPLFLLPLTLMLSYLLVAPLPLPSLKFSREDKAGNRFRYIFLGICLLLILFLKFAAVPVIVVLYLLSPVVLRANKV
ncbi:CDP-diacylglycerol--serine O-phosphatidyltransferase [Anseongella ginsenosidimutans]|uniref:CDP-diacylglycerol--serine O-phosphatidyltransferase n=2 Tax=Anseongella ginsenosidimutans TaxID=496056 RepID=A0A4R3KNF7_9SPHI|nr:CDP-diacylglycerol--serine O-phosphatidyltransferase [Anseongella ginsenosidimutans]